MKKRRRYSTQITLDRTVRALAQAHVAKLNLRGGFSEYVERLVIVDLKNNGAPIQSPIQS